MRSRFSALAGLLLTAILLVACAQAPEQDEQDHILDGKDDAFDRLDRHTR